jgi:hypothetical protein
VAYDVDEAWLQRFDAMFDLSLMMTVTVFPV